MREKGLAAAAKRAGRVAAQGLVESYIHLGGKVGVLVEVNCETDFVARNEQFRTFVKDICLQIAATNPAYLSKDDVPEEVLEKERQILRAQALNEGKPEKVIDKIIEGRIQKYYKENCLLNRSLSAIRRSRSMTFLFLIAKIGENIVIRRFSRFALGEGVESETEAPGSSA